MDKQQNSIIWLLIGVALGGIIVYLFTKLKEKQLTSTVQLIRDKDGRIIEFTTIPLGGRIG